MQTVTRYKEEGNGKICHAVDWERKYEDGDFTLCGRRIRSRGYRWVWNEDSISCKHCLKKIEDSFEDIAAATIAKQYDSD